MCLKLRYYVLIQLKQNGKRYKDRLILTRVAVGSRAIQLVNNKTTVYSSCILFTAYTK